MNLATRQRLALVIIIIAFLLLGISYVWATPPLESSDEYKHYPFVQYVQNTGKLPVLDPENPGLWLQEAAQPPLYYLLAAAVTSNIDTSDLPDVHHKNPQAFIGNPGQVGNKNLIIHDPQLETFPWRGTVLAIYVIRMVSLALSVGTILVTAHLGQRLFNIRIGLLAAAITAFNPMFLFISTAVNNDSLAILLGNLGLLLLVLIWQDVPDPRSKWWRYILLGAVIGLGVLSKLSLMGLLIPAGLALAWLSWRSKNWRILLVGGLLVIVPVVLLSGWWLVRNWQLYGDPSGLSAFIAVQGTRDMPLNLSGWLDELGTFYRSFWGLFGGVNIAAPEWFYFLMNGLVLIALIGLIKWLWAKEARIHFVNAGVWLLAAWIIVIFLLLVRWNIISPAFQGRLIFPALGAFNVLWAVGFMAWFKDKWQAKGAVLISTVLLLLAFLLPLKTIRPAYAMPQPLTVVPPEALVDPVIFDVAGGKLQLAGIMMEENQNVMQGDGPVIVTLYWQALSLMDVDYISSLHLLGRELDSTGQIDRYPAMGMIPTSRWQTGEIYRDLYHIYPNESAVSPAQLRVAVSIYDDETDTTLPAVNEEGLPVDPVFVGSPVRLGAKANDLPLLEITTNAHFQQGITLAGVNGVEGVPGETVPITLYWKASDIPEADYTVFVHLLDKNGERITGADAPPVNNYFPTSMWLAGDVVDDIHLLHLPDDLATGEYQIIVGLYDPQTGIRLLRVDEAKEFVEILFDVKHE